MYDLGQRAAAHIVGRGLRRVDCRPEVSQTKMSEHPCLPGVAGVSLFLGTLWIQGEVKWFLACRILRAQVQGLLGEKLLLVVAEGKVVNLLISSPPCCLAACKNMVLTECKHRGR